MIETKRTVVLHDGERVELPLEKGQQIWAVQISIEAVDKNTGHAYFSNPFCKKTVHVTRETLESCGLVGKKPDPPRPDEPETAEDLIIKLLSHVGVFPEE